jgi:hypothetical protein
MPTLSQLLRAEVLERLRPVLAIDEPEPDEPRGNAAILRSGEYRTEQ